MKVELDNSERLILLRFVKSEIRRITEDRKSTVKKLEKYYDLEAKLQLNKPT